MTCCHTGAVHRPYAQSLTGLQHEAVVRALGDARQSCIDKGLSCLSTPMEDPRKRVTLLVPPQDYGKIQQMGIGTLWRLLDPDNVARVMARRMRTAITSYKAPAKVSAQAPSAALHIPSGAFPGILIDVVGGCNAKCPFCVTGREDFGKRINFISVANFARALDRLIELNFAVPDWTSIGLHNWGSRFCIRISTE
jgi:hypothetical protein